MTANWIGRYLTARLHPQNAAAVEAVAIVCEHVAKMLRLRAAVDRQKADEVEAFGVKALAREGAELAAHVGEVHGGGR